MDILKILEIDKLTNEDDLKLAYRKKLKTVHPEDDPVGFKQLRQAYEQAMEMLKSKVEPELTEVERWISSVNEVYGCYPKRISLEQWQKLLSNELCLDLDTSNEARVALLNFCFRHHRLPNDIWQLIDETFDIVEDREVLCESFPKQYIDFLVNEITLKIDWLDYESFKGAPDADYDAYIAAAFKLYHRKDEQEGREQIRMMDECEIQSPWGESYKLAFYTNSSKAEDKLAAEEIEQYLRKCMDLLTLPYLIEFSISKGEFAQAILDCQILLDKNPDNAMAKYYLAVCYVETGEYSKADKILRKLIQNQVSNNVVELYFKLNRLKVEEMRHRLKLNPDDNRLKAELALNYLNLRDVKTASKIALSMVLRPDEPEYNELFASVYYELGQFERAREYALKSLDDVLGEDAVEKSVDTKMLDNDLANAYEKLAMIEYHFALECDAPESFPLALEYLDNALEFEKSAYRRLRMLSYKALTLFQQSEYEKCIEICKSSLGISNDVLVYKILLRAYYKLEQYQLVWDTYKQVIERDALDPMPYIVVLNMAIDIWDNVMAIEVLEHLDGLGRHKQLNNNELKFLKLRVQLLFKPDMRQGEVSDVLSQMTKIYNRVRKEAGEVPDYLHVIHLERARYNLFLKKYDIVLEHLRNYAAGPIEKKLEPGYYMLWTEALVESEQYEVAVDVYLEALEKYPSYLGLLRGITQCCYNLGREDMAIEYLEKIVELGKGMSTEFFQLMSLYREKFILLRDKAFYDKAVHYGKLLLELNQEASTYLLLALLYERGNDYEQLIDCANEALKAADTLEPDEVLYLSVALSTAYRLIKDFDNSISVSEQMIASEYVWEGYKNLVDCYIYKGEFGRAIHWLLEEAKINAKSERINREKIWKIYFVQGMDVAAKQAHLEMIKVSADKARTYNASGEYYLAMMNFEQAVLQFNRALSACKDEQVRIIILANLAFVHYILDDLDTTNKILADFLPLMESVHELPLSKMELYLLAEMYFYAGDTEGFFKYSDLFYETCECSPCSFYSVCVEELLLKAFEAVLDGEIDRALVLYDKVLAEEPLDISTIIRKKLLLEGTNSGNSVLLDKLFSKKKRYATLND